MGEEERDRLVIDVADALTLNQDVDWDRCAREATPASHRTLENLRVVADVLASCRVQGEEAASETAIGSRLPGGVFVRLAVQALIAFAALWVAALVALGLWGWNDFRREYGDLASYLTLLTAAPVANACLLLFAGRRDHRTWLLGVYFLLTAATINRSRSSASSGGLLQPSRSAIPTSPSRTCTRSCSRRRSCGRSLESAHGSVAGPGSTAWRAGWCRSACWSAASRGSGS